MDYGPGLPGRDEFDPPQGPPGTPPGTPPEVQPPTPEQQPVSPMQALGMGVKTAFTDPTLGQVERARKQGALEQLPQGGGAPDWLREGPKLMDWWPTNLYSRLLPKILYGLASQSPEMAVGMTAGAAFSETGPGALVAGALGYGGMHLLHQVGPYYAANLRSGLAPDKAWNKSWEEAAADGAIGGLSYAAFGGFNPLKSAAGNLALQTFLVQPGLAEAGALTHDTINGVAPTADQLLQTYGSGVAGTATSALAVGGSHMLSRFLGGTQDALAAGKPPQEQLHDLAEGAYDTIRGGSAGKTGSIQLDNNVMANNVYNWHDQIVDKFGSPKLNPEVARVLDFLDRVGTPDEYGNINTAQVADGIQAMNRLYRSAKGPNGAPQRAVASMGHDLIQKFLTDPNALKYAGVDPAEAPGIAQASQWAGTAWQGYKLQQHYDELLDTVEARSKTGDRYDVKALQSRLTTILGNKNLREEYPPEIQDTLRRLQTMGPSGFANWIGKSLTPDTFRGALTNFVLGGIAAHLGFGTGVLGTLLGGVVGESGGIGGYIAKKIAEGSRAQQVEQLAKAVPQQIAEGAVQRANQTGANIQLQPYKMKPTGFKPPYVATVPIKGRKVPLPVPTRPIILPTVPAGQPSGERDYGPGLPGMSSGGRVAFERAYRISRVSRQR